MDHLLDRWLSTKEMCAYLGLSDYKLYCGIHLHNMPIFKMGRLWIYEINKIYECVKAAEVNRKQQKNNSQ